MASFARSLIKDTGVRADWVDLRDQDYVPNLTVLRDTVSLNPNLLAPDPDTGLQVPIFGARNQGSSGRCVGFALANLIDIQRHLQHVRRRPSAPDATPPDLTKVREDIVSADMLYRMASFHDRYPELENGEVLTEEGILTLRSAIKGFYHHGVCRDWPFASAATDDSRWQSDCYVSDGPDKGRKFTTVGQAKKAREIGLGAYFRLASILNHFHAALNDAEAILTTANVHDGWLAATPDNGGLITWPPEVGKTGTHAFVVTGYDEKGFHVLNSWGPKWGGYNGQAGIALWSYADWAQNVVDSWVLRLGVFAPSAFGASVGEKGTKGDTGPIQAGSTPCFELVGHYMHLDDGYHVATGSYPSFKNGWPRTRKYLSERIDPTADPANKENIYRGVLVWIPGSLEGIKPAFADAVGRKTLIKDLGLYPYTVFWCNSFVEKSLEVLQSLFDSCQEQAGENAAHLDELIENRVRGVGRAFWRDIELGARRALRGTEELPYEDFENEEVEEIKKGFVGNLLLELLQLKKDTGCEVHVVAEGAGALVVHEMLSLLEHDTRWFDPASLTPGGMDRFDTLHLIHPAIGIPRAKKRLIPLIRTMNGPNDGSKKRKTSSRKPVVQEYLQYDTPPRARIYVPTPALEERICFGAYGKSILQLVSRAFEDRYPLPQNADDTAAPYLLRPRPFLGMSSIANDTSSQVRGAVFRLNRIAAQKHDLDRIPQSALNDDPTITNSIFECIRGFQKTGH
ncbi:C1 family peptidase [Aliiroseovarius sp. S1339]|uniref:C1 family peptidase n=1 Tax=Aliiroseovarius sp. S1339 TaxID=2936990 RepID=UPI0020BFD1C6|nr:C1 family peptidase [Aliiroseovarius sp. S1339]MCK8464965.1 C1 family peptidase [Aliiroseovarius sp. S1339]